MNRTNVRLCRYRTNVRYGADDMRTDGQARQAQTKRRTDDGDERRACKSTKRRGKNEGKKRIKIRFNEYL